MPYPDRFAGYQSPGSVLQDAALTLEQKIGALKGWRNAIRTYGRTDCRGRERLLAAIERALAALRRE